VREWRRDPNKEQYLGDGPFGEFVLSEQVSSWGGFLNWLRELDGMWCFRGQREASWSLQTSLDRTVKREYSNRHGSGYYHLNREIEARDLLFRFQQQEHRFISPLPANDDLASWFALMQH